MDFELMNEDNELLISMYDTHRFVVEQNYQITSALCVPVTEGVMSNIKEKISKIFDKIITFLTNLGEWISKKLKSSSEKIFNYISNKTNSQIFKVAEKKNKDLKLVRVEVPNAYASMTNYTSNPDDSKIFSYTLKAAEELLDFYSDDNNKKNMDYLDNQEDKMEYFLKGCPNYKKLADACDGNFKNITPYMLKELGIPETNEKIMVGGECSPSEYASKYYNNAQKLHKNFPNSSAMLRDFSIEYIKRDIINLREKADKNASKLGEKGYSQFAAITELLIKILSTQANILVSMINAINTHLRNFVKCWNIVYPRNKIQMKSDEEGK